MAAVAMPPDWSFPDQRAGEVAAAAAAMSFSSVFVVTNSLRLRRVQPTRETTA